MMQCFADTEDNDKPGTGGQGSSKRKGKAGAAKPNAKPAVSPFAAARKRLTKMLFGWLDPR